MPGLTTYRAKRDFGKTPEPRGAARPAKGSQYVIQKHAARRLHYDLRLELDGVMLSWAITRGPSLVPGEKRLAIHVEDHPIEYNSFEGTIPQGEYGGGTVMIWDRGHWVPDGDPRKGLKKGKLDFSLEGEKLQGRWHLVRLKPRPGERREVLAADQVGRCGRAQADGSRYPRGKAALGRHRALDSGDCGRQGQAVALEPAGQSAGACSTKESSAETGRWSQSKCRCRRQDTRVTQSPSAGQAGAAGGAGDECDGKQPIQAGGAAADISSQDTHAAIRAKTRVTRAHRIRGQAHQSQSRLLGRPRVYQAEPCRLLHADLEMDIAPPRRSAGRAAALSRRDEYPMFFPEARRCRSRGQASAARSRQGKRGLHCRARSGWADCTCAGGGAGNP